MGLFGTSPGKKLEKARSLLARHDYYPALQIFRELTGLAERLSAGELSEVKEGIRACRRAMIRLRLEEAEALDRAGDLAGARDRCQTALDLAGDDLEREEIEEELRRINAPRRPLAPTGRLQDAAEPDLLPEPDAVVHPHPTFLDRAPAERAPRSDAELFGEDPAALFEDVYLSTMDPETAERLRRMGPDFRFGFLALSQGEGARALEFFDRIDWTRVTDPRCRLERAHALLLADRPEESLSELETLDPQGGAPGVEVRRRYLRVEALRALRRWEEAVSAARALAEEQGEPEPLTESLLAWTLLEAGRAEEAWERLVPWVEGGATAEEILIPAAQAARACERTAEETRLLRRIIQHRMEVSLMREAELEFPVEAGRRLLALLQDQGSEPGEIRALLLHLIDHDPQEAESYRELLLQIDQTA